MKKIIKKLIALIVLVVAALLILLFGGQFGFGPGRGFGFAESVTQTDTTEEVREAETTEVKEIVIKVVEDKIYYGEVEVADIEELKAKISDDEAKGCTFVFESEYGIKSTMDDVHALLEELEKSIGIQVEYK
ncbi:MAG: hypothetical protein J5476_04105 [Lachnospiraceae bacterium]|nr:hypothetical protein [Lachnospiraceae bacterium]